MAELVELARVVGGSSCVSSDDGHAVYQRIARSLAAQSEVVISFAGIEDVTTAFLNAAIGKLYGEFSEADIRALLRVENAEPDHLALLKRVVDRAKDFFRDPPVYEAAVRAGIGE
jgi:aspartokinase